MPNTPDQFNSSPPGEYSADVSRRAALGGAAALAAMLPATRLAAATERKFTAADYDRTIIIDAQSGVGDPDPAVKPEDPMSPALRNALKISGTTACVTLGSVGNVPSPFHSAIADIPSRTA